MGRPSKLTPTQWDEIGRRRAGERDSALAKEFGVAQSQISRRFSHESQTQIRKVAQELAALPVKDHSAAVTLADELRAISSHLAAGARYGSATAHRLQALAHSEVQKLADDDPLGATDDGNGLEVLKGVNALTRSANDAASMGLNLLNANKDRDIGGSGEINARAELMRRRRVERIERG